MLVKIIKILLSMNGQVKKEREINRKDTVILRNSRPDLSVVTTSIWKMRSVAIFFLFVAVNRIYNEPKSPTPVRKRKRKAERNLRYDRYECQN